MIKFRTTGSCPASQPNLGGGCGLALDKIWETNAPEKVETHVKVRCTRCMSLFMAVNTPIEEVAEPKIAKQVDETITKYVELVIELVQTTTHYTGDNMPIVTKKPTLRVRTESGNWFTLSKASIDELLSH